MRMISIYEGQREMLIREHTKLSKELKSIQEAGARMTAKMITYMNELIDYMMFLDDQIEILECRINSIGII